MKRSTLELRSSLLLLPLPFVFRQLLVPAIILFIHPALCKDEEDTLLQGLNSYRTSLGLTPLAKNEKAFCLADEIANQIEDQPCVNTTLSNAIPGSGPQLASYPNLLAKCDIHIENTKDGVILPVCVPRKVPGLVLMNYTRTGYGRYLNESRFTGAGIGMEDDWTVLILTTNTQQGGYASWGSSGREARFGVGFVCVVVVWLILNGH